MSQIFDALLRSEADRVGQDPGMQVEATELLQRFEHQATVAWASGSGPAQRNAPLYGEFQQSVDPSAISGAASIDEHFDVEAIPQQKDIVQLGQFATQPMLLTPDSRLVSMTERESPTAEAFRLLGVRLRDLRRTHLLKKILITSTVPREGKSTVAANLAYTLAHKTGEKILLLEGDVRRPALTRIFGLGAIPGLCELLGGKSSLSESIYRLEGADVWILPAGSSSKTPLELLQSARLPALLNQLAALFDWVIIDSPPILPLADTSVWARNVDGILLAVRSGVTEKKQLNRGLQALESEKLIGALLNGSKASAFSDYYYQPIAGSQ